MLWEELWGEHYEAWRKMLASMLTLPWRSVVRGYNTDGTPEYIDKGWQLLIWVSGWIVTLAGIIGTGIYLPYWVLAWHIPVAFQIYVEIGGAFLGGFIWQAVLMALWQAVATVLMIVRFIVIVRQLSPEVIQSGSVDEPFDRVGTTTFLIIFYVPALLLVGLTGFLLYWYFTNFAPHHDLVGTGILGATLLKLAISFGPTVIKAIGGGYILRWFLKKIRGEPPKQPKGTAPT